MKPPLSDTLVICDMDNTLLTAKAQLAQAEAQRVNAANNLSYTVVTSPSDGIVGTLPYKVGALVGPSTPQPLTTVSDNSEMYVYFSMTENQLLNLTREYGSIDNTLKNMPDVQLRLNDGSVYDEAGRIEAISGVIDTSTGSVQLRAAFPNPNGLLHSGGAGQPGLVHVGLRGQVRAAALEQGQLDAADLGTGGLLHGVGQHHGQAA